MAAKRTAPKKDALPINTYGCNFPGQPQVFYDMWAFAHRVSVDRGTPSRPELFKRIAEHWLPGHFEWHSWTDKVVNGISENYGKQTHLIAFPGASNSAKTFNVSSFAAVWWLSHPYISSVTIVSTTKQSLRKRGWAEIQRVWSKLNTNWPGIQAGNFVDSRMMWQANKGDDKHAITGRAVEEGSIFKVADDIKGVHTRRQMIIIDEATAIPDAIWDAMNNLCSYPQEFIVIAMANPRNYIQRFSRFMEPRNGWASVTIDTEEWEGKPQTELSNATPVVIRFDAEKSPNILEGKIVSKHLPTKEKVEAAKKDGGGNTPNYWTNMRGFPPPEGLVKSVFSLSAFEMVKAYDKHLFSGRNFIILGAVDPAFGGGDMAMIRFAKMGLLSNGEYGIEMLPPKSLPINAQSTNPVHYQLAEQIRRECERVEVNGIVYSCKPDNLGLDATGEGGGLCDILARTWSPNIVRIEFGGAVSEGQVSLEDVRQGKDVWRNKRAEMYFRARQTLDAGQLRGVDRETAEEISTIEFLDDKAKIVIISKQDYRKQFGKSPDKSDCFVEIVEVARRRGFSVAARGETRRNEIEADKSVQGSQELYDEKNLYAPEEINADDAMLV